VSRVSTRTLGVAVDARLLDELLEVERAVEGRHVAVHQLAEDVVLAGEVVDPSVERIGPPGRGPGR
jgi:hypothetical protein